MMKRPISLTVIDMRLKVILDTEPVLRKELFQKEIVEPLKSYSQEEIKAVGELLRKHLKALPFEEALAMIDPIWKCDDDV